MCNKMTEQPAIDILLPTYNGETFLSQQLDSFHQENVVTKLWVRDDMSNDATVALLHDFAQQYPLECLPSTQRVGVVANVNTLLEHTNAYSCGAYFALADQDDIWYANKLYKQWCVMQELEQCYGTHVPLLVYSDAHCVDAQGSILQSSFLRHIGVPATWGTSLQQALIMSPVLGCSCLGNAALRQKVLPLPPASDIFMHDWWIYLVAMCFGHTSCLHEPLLAYRQHEHNVLGAQKRGSLRQKFAHMRKNAQRTQQQAATFLARFAPFLSPEQQKIFEAWATMPETPYFLRRYQCFSQGFAKPGLRAFWT